MICTTLSVIAGWCGGTVAPEYAEVSIRGVSTDTRTIQAGQLFIPLQGDRFDGHDYIEAAIQAGAAAVLTARDLSPEIPAIRVEDIMKAMLDISSAYRDSLKARVVAITGSVGKTTTKEMIAAILATTYRVWKTRENHNNRIGLSQTLLDTPADTEYLVLELGMNHFGEMRELTAVAKPDWIKVFKINLLALNFSLAYYF